MYYYYYFLIIFLSEYPNTILSRYIIIFLYCFFDEFNMYISNIIL